MRRHSFLAISVVVALLTSLLTLSSCDRPARDGDGSDDSRHHSWIDHGDERDEPESQPRETRALEHFEKIEVRGAAELEIKVGGAPSIELQGSRRSVRRVEVDGDTLVIDVTRSRGWFTHGGSLKATVSAPALKSLDCSGAGEITITGLQGGEQRIRLAGAHDLTAKGTLDKLDIEVSGAGHADYDGVKATDAKVQVNGAGEVDVQVTGVLRAELNGVGSIRYSGNPAQVQSEVHGLGAITRRDGGAHDADTSDDEPVEKPDAPAMPAPPATPEQPAAPKSKVSVEKLESKTAPTQII